MNSIIVGSYNEITKDKKEWVVPTCNVIAICVLYIVTIRKQDTIDYNLISDLKIGIFCVNMQIYNHTYVENMSKIFSKIYFLMMGR